MQIPIPLMLPWAEGGGGHIRRCRHDAMAIEATTGPGDTHSKYFVLWSCHRMRMWRDHTQQTFVSLVVNRNPPTGSYMSQ